MLATVVDHSKRWVTRTVFAVVLILLLLAEIVPALAAPNYAREKWAAATDLQGYSGASRGSWKSILVFGALGLGAVGVFGYWYVREWYLNRRFRSYRIGLGPNTTLQPLRAADREPLVAKDRDQQRPGSDLSGLCVPSARPTLLRSGKPSARSGVLNIRAEDELHEIFVDGEFVGMTPSKLTLLEGAHLVEIKRAGRKNFKREIRIIAGAEANLRPVLETRIEVPGTGTTN